MLTAFRVDGSKKIGLGHLMRCLCLAEGLRQEGWESFFIVKNYSHGILDFILQKNFKMEILPAEINLSQDLTWTKNILLDRKPDFVVIDSYDIDGNYLDEIKNTGIFLISIDDKAILKFPSDLVINPNLGFQVSDYRGLESSKLLLGPKYALLREEFKENRVSRTFEKKPQEVLISFGGSDNTALVQRILNCLHHLQLQFHMTAVLGQENSASFSEFQNSPRVEIVQNATNMAKRMADADLAILSAGTTAWEAACLGLPAVLLQIATNQKKNAEQLQVLGISINCGPAEEIIDLKLEEKFEGLFKDASQRKQMSLAGQALVDGDGTLRIVSEIKKRIAYEKN